MIQIFYKEKPIIISDKKSDLKNSLVIDSELLQSLDLLALLTKKKVNSIGILSKKVDLLMGELKKKFPEIIAAGGKVINKKSEILFIYRNKKWDLPKGKAEKNENISLCIEISGSKIILRPSGTSIISYFYMGPHAHHFHKL